MSNEKKSGFDKVPGPDTFSFDSYIQGKSTFPEFSHTVYLDQAAGAELGEAITSYEESVASLKALRLQQERAMESGALSLADDTLADLAVQIDEEERELEKLDAQMAELTEKIKSTSLTLNFQAGTPQKYGKVIRQAEKEYAKAHGRVDDSDMEHVTGRTRMVLVHQLAAYCVSWTTPDGKTYDAPGKESLAAMTDSLIASETLRLLTALNGGLDASAEWASRIDAGFLGGGADVGSEPVGGSGAEDGEVVGDSAA
jgi:uncharacterized coiled-coil protein SlyX